MATIAGKLSTIEDLSGYRSKGYGIITLKAQRVVEGGSGEAICRTVVVMSRNTKTAIGSICDLCLPKICKPNHLSQRELQQENESSCCYNLYSYTERVTLLLDRSKFQRMDQIDSALSALSPAGPSTPLLTREPRVQAAGSDKGSNEAAEVNQEKDDFY